MNEQFIQGVIFDWKKTDNDSYLKRIEAFRGVEKLDFNKSITFFCRRTKNYVFSTHDTHSDLCDAIRIAKGYRKEKWGYFLRAESFYIVANLY